MLQAHPDWFRDDVIPHDFAGEEYWDRNGRWFGCVLSSYGIVANRDSFQRLGLPLPSQWDDLTNPRLRGEVALADPTKSSSIAKAFENVIQQQMQRRLLALQKDEPGLDPKAAEARAIREGWIAGLQLMQLVAANSRYFTDTSQKPPIDVAQGNAAAGICIDFYGRQQDEAVRRRGGSSRLAYVSPVGGTVSSVDPIGLLRGAKNRQVALAFIEYVLSLDGQKLWDLRPGTPGGPQHYALRRMPVRRDFYARADMQPLRSDPEASPFTETEQLVYREAWSGGVFREMALIIRIVCMDTHPELVRAWQAIVAAGRPARALAVLQDMSAVDYERARGAIKQALASRDKTDEIRTVRELGDRFRAQYRKAEELARTGP
jgi:iron(III) transport system substrate-binding protein